MALSLVIPYMSVAQDQLPDSSGFPSDRVSVISPHREPVLRSNDFLHTALFLSGATVVTAGMIHYDQQMYSTLYRWKLRSTILSNISPVITNLGEGSFSLGIFGSYLGYGIISDNARALQIGKIGLESFAASGIVAQVLKNVFGREQPNVSTISGGRWNGPLSYFRKHFNHSRGIASFDAFPSGHTTTAFAAATTLADLYDEPWIGYASYSMASLIAISRVMERTHWVSDCFVGGLIGVLSTHTIEKLNALPPSVSLGPVTFHHVYGVGLSVVI